jgi:hypothetical protein
LFPESNERLQAHLKERMHSLEEKNHLSNELERTKKRLEDSIQAKARAEQKLADLVKNRNGHSIGYVYFYPLFPTRLTDFFFSFFPRSCHV